jgi:predicted nucleic acid-binding protein
LIYLDSSALVKLAHVEAESLQLEEWLAGCRSQRRVASTLVEVEVPRALRRRTPDIVLRTAAVLSNVDLLDIDSGIRAAAAAFPDPMLRSLDAIHLATALRFRAELSAVVSYDRRLLDAATAVGLPAVSPGLQ